jgi:lipopolysaccharide cholinephosphotransferase
MSTTPRSLDLIHKELLGQMEDIIKVCSAHHIPYAMMCGSLLGAVRHKGFIPWDDDIDLIITREAYERFAAVYPKECDEKYLLSRTNTWTPRVMSKDPLVADAFTDLFIMDYLPEGKLNRRVRLTLLRFIQGMLKKNVDYSRFSLPQRMALFTTHILGLPFSVEQKTAWYDSLSKRTKQGREVHMSNGAFGLLSMTWDPKLFDDLTEAPFEHLTVLIPRDYHTVLVKLFGTDYMTPPPESERVAKHLDL